MYFVIFIIFLQATSLLMLNHLSCINFILQCFVSLQSSNMCFTSSSPKHKGHLSLSTFHLTPLSCHISANNNAIPLLSFLEQHSIYSFLPQGKLNSLFSVNELFFRNFASIFSSPYHYISFSLTLTLLSNYTLVVSSTQMPI